MPKLTATPEMKQAAIADEPKQHESPYGYRYVERTYYPYMNCVVQDGILKAAFYLPEHLRLDGNNPAYEVFLDKKAHQFLTYDHLEKKWRDAKLDRLNWPGRNYYATCWASEKDAAVVQDYLCGERGGDLGILDFQRNVRDEQLEQRHKRITGAWDQDLAQVPELPKDWMRWIDKVAVRENFIFYRYKRGGAQNGYAMNISSWQGFRFVRRLLQKYTPVQLQKFFGERFFFHELFVRGNRYSSRDYELFIKRSFLTEEQHRQLFEWIEASFFQMEPERYQEFIWCALQDSDVQRLYDRRLLASVLRSLLSSGKYAGGRADHLKEKFYSKEELEADQKADAEKAEREERLRREQEHQKKCERLEQTYDGTMSSLKEFTKSFYYDRDVKEALDMVYEKLREQPAGCAAAFEADELEHFFKLCGDLARNNPGEEQKILNMARTMMGGLAA